MPAASMTDQELRKAVAEIIKQLRPAVQGDGGDIEFVGLDDKGVVHVRLHGACVGCPSSEMTLKLGVEQALRSKLPQVQEVVCVSPVQPGATEPTRMLQAAGGRGPRGPVAPGLADRPLDRSLKKR